MAHQKNTAHQKKTQRTNTIQILRSTKIAGWEDEGGY